MKADLLKMFSINFFPNSLVKYTVASRRPPQILLGLEILRVPTTRIRFWKSEYLELVWNGKLTAFMYLKYFIP